MEPWGSLLHSQVPATCPYPEPARTSPSPHPTFLKIHLNIILPSTPGSCKWSLSLRFPHQNPVYASPLPPICAACTTHLILLNLITRTILGEGNRSLSSSLCSFLHSRYLVPVSPKYSAQQPILKYPQSMFLPQCEWPSFTPIQNKRQNYSCVCLNL